MLGRRYKQKVKEKCNRKFRKESKRRVALDEEPLYDLNEACNVYDFDRDGLARYINNLDDKYLRK
jgi:hypothetical protein